MKKLVFATLVVMGVAFQAQAQSGGGIGGFTQREMDILFGADVGKGGGDGQINELFQDITDVTNACEGVATELRWSFRQAIMKGTNVLRRQTLKNGIDDALRIISRNWGYQPLTRRALERAQTLNTLISGACSKMTNPASIRSCLELETDVAVYALSRVYLLILEHIIPLDENYYIPYQRHYKKTCLTFDCLPEYVGGLPGQGDGQPFRDPFITAYAEAGAGLLKFYYGTSPASGHLPEAFGKSFYEARVAEHATFWAAEDLGSDLARRNYSCLIGGLARANGKLARYNAGTSKADFQNDDDAAAFGREVIGYASEKLEQIRTCGPRGPF